MSLGSSHPVHGIRRRRAPYSVYSGGWGQGLGGCVMEDCIGVVAEARLPRWSGTPAPASAVAAWEGGHFAPWPPRRGRPPWPATSCVQDGVAHASLELV
eukprot:127315-Chlamydomonas_euryale.AAC.1